MYSHKLVFLLLILGSVVAYGAQFQYAEVQLEGSCPRIRYITNLDLPRIIGWYYRVFSNLDNPLCLNNDAQTMFAATIDATGINVAFCCRSAADPTVTTCGEDIGSGRVTALSSPGEFTYQTKDNIYPQYILDTDYDNFTIVYGCKPGSGTDQRDETIFVYSRSYSLSVALKARVLLALERNGIQWSKARPVRQGSSMPYLPRPKE